ncbi:hypothetical protein M426DRAFT_200432 [Hypoxylon sp. CI-4A]|nr:hypothetical protein M426DRAFT_200432 [Hypoxylon sp. CI-4A]
MEMPGLLIRGHYDGLVWPGGNGLWKISAIGIRPGSYKGSAYIELERVTIPKRYVGKERNEK